MDIDVDQEQFESYLRSRVPGFITIKHQSKRKNSARYWREIYVDNYDSTYLYSKDKEKGITYQYLRSRVIDFK